MRVIVIGAGIIGVTSAYCLACKGYDVTVVDRRDGIASETSFANAGEVSPGYSAPWSGPGVPLKALRWMLSAHAPLIVRARLDMDLARWLFRFAGNCTAARYATNKTRMLELGEYSRGRLETLRDTLGIAYDQRTLGTLQLFRTTAQADGVDLDRQVLDAAGVRYEMLDPQGCIEVEPALARVRGAIAGGMRLPGDETGDCYKFSQALGRAAGARGVRFAFGTGVSRILAERDRVVAIETGGGMMEADAYVVATASYTRQLVRPLGLDVPIYPVKGYSLTARITDPTRAPVSTVLDETYKVATTRLGDRMRIGGLAELCGFDTSLPPKRRRVLEASAGFLFDGSCDLETADFWTGLRPMTPDGPPLIGRSHLSNLYLNCGHGTLGWTMACGSAAMLADIVAGVSSALPEANFSPLRFRC